EKLAWRERFKKEQRVSVCQHLALAAVAVILMVILETVAILTFEPKFSQEVTWNFVCLCCVFGVVVLLLLLTLLFQVRQVLRSVGFVLGRLQKKPDRREEASSLVY